MPAACRDVVLHTGSYIDATGGITIGSALSISLEASLRSTEHTWDNPETRTRYNPLRRDPIVIESDVVVFAGTRVPAGAHIQSHNHVAVNAVARRGAYPSGLYAGVPARLLGAF